VIVTCERCETEFQLDDARVPETGARVRCSRCKHAFFVSRPSAAEPDAASGEELFDRAAESALAASETPDVTEDLPDRRSEDLFGELPRERDDEPARASAEPDESDWQFNAEPPADRDEPERPPIVERRRPRAVEPEPAPAEELGSPSEWNIFDDVAAGPAPAAAPEPPRAKVQRRLYVPGFDSVETPEEAPSPIVQRTICGAGWIATACLFAIAVWHGIAPARMVETVWAAPAPGVALEGVRGRWLENLNLGRLYVVSGQLRNESPSAFVALPALEVELRDGSGRALDARFALALPLAPDRLREADAAELSAAPGLGGALRGGETRAFEVVAWPLPAQAQRFAIRVAAPGS
jgi:predicted Zn finger-like uncharacterized protein